MRGSGALRTTVAVVALLILAQPAAAHGSQTATHGHLLPVVVFLGGLLVLAASLAADHYGAVERTTADVGVVGGAVAVVLSVGLLWL